MDRGRGGGGGWGRTLWGHKYKNKWKTAHTFHANRLQPIIEYTTKTRYKYSNGPPFFFSRFSTIIDHGSFCGHWKRFFEGIQLPLRPPADISSDPSSSLTLCWTVPPLSWSEDPPRTHHRIWFPCHHLPSPPPILLPARKCSSPQILDGLLHDDT